MSRAEVERDARGGETRLELLSGNETDTGEGDFLLILIPSSLLSLLLGSVGRGIDVESRSTVEAGRSSAHALIPDPFDRVTSSSGVGLRFSCASP